MTDKEDGPDEKTEIIENFASQLSEHFDAVQIIATSVMPSGRTKMWSRGSGNNFSRMAMTRYYADQFSADIVADSIKEAIEPIIEKLKHD